MELDEAIVVLFRPPSPAGASAYGVVAAFLEACARRQGAREPEDIAQDVLERLLRRAGGGETPWTDPGAGKAYLRKCAERAAIDEHRREKRQSVLPVELSRQPAAPPLDGDERALVEKVAGVARNRRAPRYRAEFDATWSEISALAFEGAELRELLLTRGTLRADSSDVEAIKVRNRVYKNHERVRNALRAAVTDMTNGGQLSAADAELALRCLRILVRCQRSEPLSVSPPKKDGP
jgi:hypothetical protein